MSNDIVQEVLNQRREVLEEKQEYLEDRYSELADKHRQASSDRYQQARQVMDHIPLGQPILVGHHSEGSHRADIKRIDNNMRRSIEHDNTAKYYEAKLNKLQNNTTISSDEPDALEKLKAKLADMESNHEFMKLANKVIRKVLKMKLDLEDSAAKVHELENSISIALAKQLLTPDFCGRTGYASFELSNNNANMKRVKARIAEIERQHEAIANAGESSETRHEDINLTVVENHVINRLQLVFDDKPDESVRSLLKSSGFRWSRSEMAWQRQLTENAKWSAESIIRGLRS